VEHDSTNCTEKKRKEKKRRTMIAQQAVVGKAARKNRRSASVRRKSAARGKARGRGKRRRRVQAKSPRKRRDAKRKTEQEVALLVASLKLTTGLREQAEEELWRRRQEEDEGMKDYAKIAWRASESEEPEERDWEVDYGGDVEV
jgi:hypothetical protein